jgi:hypothetical protein
MRTRTPRRERERWVVWIAVGVLGALFALAWRTPMSGPLMLRLGEISILAVCGMAVGVALGGSTRAVLRQRLPVRALPLPVILGAVVLIGSTRLSPQAGWIAAGIGLAVIGIWSLQRGWYPVVCTLLGGLCNEIARGVNGGRMPVATTGLPADLSGDFATLDSSTLYQAVDAHTRLPWLADRFSLFPLPGVASPGDILLALGIAWIFAAVTRIGRSEPTMGEIAPAA